MNFHSEKKEHKLLQKHACTSATRAPFKGTQSRYRYVSMFMFYSIPDDPHLELLKPGLVLVLTAREERKKDNLKGGFQGTLCFAGYKEMIRADRAEIVWKE